MNFQLIITLAIVLTTVIYAIYKSYKTLTGKNISGCSSCSTGTSGCNSCPFAMKTDFNQIKK